MKQLKKNTSEKKLTIEIDNILKKFEVAVKLQLGKEAEKAEEHGSAERIRSVSNE